MVSPEVLRRYPFFGIFENHTLREVAMITEEIELQAGQNVFEAGEQANYLYLLMSGGIHLHFVIAEENGSSAPKDYMVGTINQGELLGISAIIQPHIMTATAVAASACKLLQIEAAPLRQLSEATPKVGCALFIEIAKTIKERLMATRVLLAAASAPEWT